MEQELLDVLIESPDSSGSGLATAQPEGVLQGAEVSSSVPVLPNSCT